MRYLIVSFLFIHISHEKESPCNPFYVRWPRVRLNFKPVANARLSLRACESACSLGEDPQTPGRLLECAALNHHPSPDGYAHHCDVFQPHQLQNVDGYVEADDRYSFYWKYCLNTTRKCGGEYAFTYHSDRYMDARDVTRVIKKGSLEECLVECLDEKSVPCRSISFNRTDGGCHISADSQLTKPQAIHLNNNPNFRIDYYENNCYNLSDTFKFEEQCREDGILVKVKSKFPYTGALYGLYDFFTCRIEPKGSNEFEYLFPSPHTSKNCSDSIRFQGDQMVLDVVLSTDGIEPLYFITPDDLTFQAKCPLVVSKTDSRSFNAVEKEYPTKAMSEASTTSRSETTTKNDTSSPHQKTSTTKAKLFKQTYPLPLTTTSEPPTQTSDTTFKQVLQQIIRAHIVEESQIVQNFKRSRSSLSVDDQSIPFRSQLAPPVFRSQFQAPIFDFFSRLAAHDDALESFPATTTTSPMESDLPLIPDSEQEGSAELPNEAEKSIISSGQVSSGTIDIQVAEPASTEPSSSDRQLSPIFSNSPILSTTVAPKTSNGSRPNDGGNQQTKPLVLSNLEQVSNVTKPTSDIPVQGIRKSISYFSGSSRIEQLIRLALEKLSPNTTNSALPHRQPSQISNLVTAPESGTRQPLLHIRPVSPLTEEPDDDLQSSTTSIISLSTTITNDSRFTDRSPLVVTPSGDSAIDTEEHHLNSSRSSSGPTELMPSSPLDDTATSTISPSKESAAAVRNRLGSGSQGSTLPIPPMKSYPAAVIPPHKNSTVHAARHVSRASQSSTVSTNSLGISLFGSSTTPVTTPSNAPKGRRLLQTTSENPSMKFGTEKSLLVNNITAVFTKSPKIVTLVTEKLFNTSRSSTVESNSWKSTSVTATTALPVSISVATLRNHLSTPSQSPAVLESSTDSSEAGNTIITTFSPAEEVATGTERYNSEAPGNSTFSADSTNGSRSQSLWVSTMPPTTGSVGSLTKDFGNVTGSPTASIFPTKAFPLNNRIAIADITTGNPVTDTEKHFNDTLQSPSGSTNSAGSSSLESTTMAVLLTTADAVFVRKHVDSSSQGSFSSELSTHKGENAFEAATSLANADANSEEESDDFIANTTDLGNRTETTTIPTFTMNINSGTGDVETVMPLITEERDVKQGEDKSLSHPSIGTWTLLKDTDAAKNVKTDSPGLLSNKGLERIPAIERHHSLPSSKVVLRLGQKGVSVRKVGDKRIALQNFSSNRTIWDESPAPAADATKELIEGGSVLLQSSSATDRKNMRGRTQQGKIEDSDPKAARTMATAPIKSVSFSNRKKSSHPRKQLTPSLQTKSRPSEGNAMTELVSATLEVRSSNPVVDRSLAKLHRAESPVRASQEPIRNKNVGTTKKTRNRIGEKRRKIAAVHKIRNPKLILRRNSLMIPIKRGHNLAILPNPKIAVHRNRNVNRSSLNVSVDASEKSLKETGREQLGVLKAARVLSHGKVPTATDGPKNSLTLKLQNEIAQLTQAAVDQDSNGLNSTQLSGRVAALLRLLAASVESAKEGSAKRSAALPSSIERQPTKNRAAPVKSKIGFSAAAALARDVARNKQEISTSHKGLHSTKPTRTPMRQVLPAPQKVHLAPRSPLSKFGSLHASSSILSINQKFPARLINSPKSKSRAAPTRPLPRAIPLSSKFLKLPTTPEGSAALQKILRATKTPSSRTLFHHSRRLTTSTSTTSTTTEATTRPSTTLLPTTTTKPPTTSPTSTTTTTQKTSTTTAATTVPITSTTSTTVTPPTIKVSLNRSPEISTAGPPAPERAAGSSKSAKGAVSFDIFHNGQPVEAVVVGTKITLSFTPLYAIPPDYMSVQECQVEPIDSKYEWEREPLPIIREGCQADLVGLVCPPKRSEYGVKITVESFRYQSTPHVQYSCLVRICPFAPCPSTKCPPVEGCPSDKRVARGLSLEEIRRALEADPKLASQIGIPPHMLANRPGHSVEHQLLALGGEHTVKRRLVVVNSEDQLRYYVRTGDLM